jgi:hypothetical protein
MLVAGALALFAVACSSSSESEGTDEDGNPVVNSECRRYSAIHSNPQCDGCTRDLCCPEVQGCIADSLCAGLMKCLLQCERGDTACTSACKGEFPGGDTALSSVSSCAEKSCPIACGTAYIEP